MNPVGLCLEPLDVLFFRDGRQFGAACRVTSGLPTPQVLAGVARTALLEKYGCSFQALAPHYKRFNSFEPAAAEAFREQAWIGRVRFRGPWLCRLPHAAGGPDVFLPAPATLQQLKKGETRDGVPPVRVLTPLRTGDLPGWRDTLRPLWLTGTESREPASGFIDPAGLAAFLRGDEPDQGSLRPAGDFYELDDRTGIGVNWDRSAAGDGEIYGIRFLSLKRDIGFYAEVVLPADAPADALNGVPFLALGGEGKRVGVRVLEKPLPFPEFEPAAGGKSFLLLTTPGVTTDDGKPYLPAGCVAAAVGPPVARSGWDMARNGPKPTRFAAPAGSVYFFDSAAPAPEPDEFGHGCHLRGVWTDG